MGVIFLYGGVCRPVVARAIGFKHVDSMGQPNQLLRKGLVPTSRGP